jgi:hypothetical protein
MIFNYFELLESGSRATSRTAMRVGIATRSLLLPLATAASLFIVIYLPPDSLFSLLSPASRPRATRALFLRCYNTFVDDPQNARYLVEGFVHLGRASRCRYLTGEGLVAFAKRYNRLFQFCAINLQYFLDACVFTSASKLPRSYLSPKDTPMAPGSLQPVNALLEALKAGDALCNVSFLKSEKRRVFGAHRVFYILQLVGDTFCSGTCTGVGTLQDTLNTHALYKTANFVKVYGVYLFGDSAGSTCDDLSKDFTSEISGLLKIPDDEVTRRVAS